jgi:hypothetical protein
MAIAILGAMATRSVGAQQPAPRPQATTRQQPVRPPWRMSVRADNDAFNFWRGITDRPDKEYTNGDDATLELSSAPWWGRRFAKRLAPCTGEESPDVRCLTTAFSLSQDMYTPKPSREPRETPDWRDDRPYAALLYGSGEAREIGEQSMRAVTLHLGVIGPPAFGEFAQRTAHKLTGVYSQTPIGWDTQVSFEPLVMLSGQTTWRFAGRTPAGRAVIDFMPQVGASVGNILTGGQGGFQMRTGINLSSPWRMSEWSTRAPVELYLTGGMRGEAVAHNITLDGNTLGAERRVDRVPLVGEYSVGIGGRYRGFVAEWRAVTRSREYRTGPQAHAYSTLFASYEVPAHAGR